MLRDVIAVMFLVQIIIVEFGGAAFSTTGLTIDQWTWCFLFGAGELLWGQVWSLLSVQQFHTKYPLDVSSHMSL